jgi:two-component system, OmpR family, alkaline phosphatase synthesis response regulator PhoP
MSEQSTQPKILIVEDDKSVSYLLEFILNREGFATASAPDGRAAEELFESETLPLLILLDVMLPYQDGFQLIRIIRTKRGWGDVPIIMLTSNSHEDDIVRALDSGANDYVVKPFQPNELLARVRRLVKDRQ